METFKDKVPFDLGYSAIYVPIIGDIEAFAQEYSKLKASHQKKFWLVKFEPQVINLIEKNSAFYLGCMLWGGFLHFRFPNKEITGNATANISEEERAKFDCAEEVKIVLNFIKNLDRDFVYLLKRHSKVSKFTREILENYVEFAQQNENFIDTKNTNNIKTPKGVEHFKDLSPEKLDELYAKIKNAINATDAKSLLGIGFYKN